MMDTSTEVDIEPPVLLAQMVWILLGTRVVEIPDIQPLEVLKDKPSGSGGSTSHSATAPPSIHGTMGPILVLTVKV